MSGELARRISLFQFVRDIPYRIALSRDEQDYCCATKSPMLQKLLASIGLESRRIWCRFRWSETPVPAAVRAQSPTDEGVHEYLEVLCPETREWVIVDPTWDVNLAEAGFAISQWDGKTATEAGVKPFEVFTHAESAALIAEWDIASPEKWQSYYDAYGPFLYGLNKWLAQQRQSSEQIYA